MNLDYLNKTLSKVKILSSMKQIIVTSNSIKTFLLNITHEWFIGFLDVTVLMIQLFRKTHYFHHLIYYLIH